MSEPNKLLSIEDWSHNEGNGGAQEDVIVCATHNAGFKLIKDDLIVNPKSIDVEELLDGGQMRHIISDETIDRHGDVVRAGGWDIANFKKNPVILWAHDHRQPPVGKATRIIKRVKEKQLVAVGEYPSASLYEFGNTAFRLAVMGYLNAVSVGFMPKEYEPIDEEKPWSGYDIKKQELWEYSIVPVPANPNALQNAIKGMPGGMSVIKRWAEQVLDMTPKENTALDELRDALHTVEGSIKTFIVDGIRFEPVKKQTVFGFMKEREAALIEPDEDETVIEPDAPEEALFVEEMTDGALFHDFSKIVIDDVAANTITDHERAVIKEMGKRTDKESFIGTRDHEEDIQKKVEEKDDPVVLTLSAEPMFNIEASVITNMVADAVTKVTGRLIDREV